MNKHFYCRSEEEGQLLLLRFPVAVIGATRTPPEVLQINYLHVVLTFLNDISILTI